MKPNLLPAALLRPLSDVRMCATKRGLARVPRCAVDGLRALGLGVALLTGPASQAQSVPQAPRETPGRGGPSAAPAASTPVAAAASVPLSTAQALASYKPVSLASWVPMLRTPGRIILQPSGVSFQASLVGLPRPQKSDYLQFALRTMQVSQPPKVGHALLLRYGDAPEQQLMAYVEDAVAARIGRELALGERREFFAFHVYNYAKGPALVITGFGPAR